MKDFLLRIYQNKRVHLPLYLVLLLVLGLYVNTIINSENIKIETQEEKEEGFDIKPVSIILRVEEPISKDYSTRMENVDTTYDLFKRLKNETGTFAFEITEYSDRLSIDHINNIYPKEGMVWALFDGDKDITNDFKEYSLRDNTAYSLKLIRIEEFL